MEITLISPKRISSSPQPPLGILTLASVLENNKHKVNIIDCDIQEFNINKCADIIGITSMTPNANNAFELMRQIKRLKPNCIIIYGGQHFSLLPLETMHKVKQIDFGIVGEGEEALVELIQSIDKGDKKYDHITGLHYRQGKIVCSNPIRLLMKDLNKVPIPAYHLIDINKYRPYPPHGRYLPYMAVLWSRGCPYSCVYCSKPCFGKVFRSISLEQIEEEVKLLVNTYEIKELMLYDDTFTLDRQRTIDICNILQPFNIAWSCETRVNLVDPELLKIMKASGCYFISYGVETGSQRLLNVLKKGVTLEQIEKAFDMTRKAKIKTIAYMMFGIPTETFEESEKSIEFVKKIKADFVQFSLCTPYPGTELFSIAMKEGMVLKDWDDFLYVGKNKPVYHPEFKPYISKGYKAFYLRPSYIMRSLFSIRSIDDIKLYANGLKMFVGLSK